MYKICKSDKNFSSFSFFTSLHLLIASYRGVFRTWSNIYNGVFLQKYLTALSCSLFSEKRLHHRCLTELKIDFCYRSEILSLLLFLVYKLSRENTQPENICDIVFEKAQGRAGKVDKTSVYAEAALRRFFKNRFMRNFAEFAKKKKKVLEPLF